MTTLPIRKVVAGSLATALVFVARKAGFVISDSTALSDANLAIGWAVAYLVPDPRVQNIERKGLALFRKLRTLNALLSEYGALQRAGKNATASLARDLPVEPGPVAAAAQASTDAALHPAKYVG